MLTRSKLQRAAAVILLAGGVFAAPAVRADGGVEIRQTAHFRGAPASECGSGHCADGLLDSSCCKTCVATVEKETVEKHCWETESKDVCIPKVVLPWQEGGSGLTIFNFLKKRRASDSCIDGCTSCVSCPKPRCGKVITVCDLKKKTYEAEKCVCKWEIRQQQPCCDSCCSSDGGCCGETCCDP